MQYIYKDRIIHIEWSIFKGTSPVREDFSRALVKCFLVGPNEKYLLDATAEGGKLLMDIPQGLPEGAYSLETIYVKNWNSLLPVRDTITPSDAPVPHRVPRPGINPNDHNTIHPHDFRGNERSLMRSRVEYAFAITSYPTEADDTESSGEVTLPLKSSVASYGYDGLSAYEIAVLRGDFDGTESEWLEWTHERIVADVKDLLQQLKDRDTRFVVKTQSQRDNLPDIKDGDEVYVTDDAMGYVLKEENGERIWMPSDYGSVTAKYILSFIADMPNFVADRAIADEFGKRIVDEYLTRDAVRNYISEIYNDLFVKNPPYIMDGYITVDMLSDAVKQLIGFGPIVNFPDDEFLTTKGGRITLKDKDYNPNSYSGMGRRILRKNMVNGVNVLTQRMMLCPNTIYVISYDYDLRGQTITVPENCVLQFKGGSIKDGTIIGNNTKIETPSISIFGTNIVLSGSWKVQEVYPEWFGAKGDNSTDCTIAIQKAIDFAELISSNVKISSGEYIIKNTLYIKKQSRIHITGDGKYKTFIYLNSDTQLESMIDINSKEVTTYYQYIKIADLSLYAEGNATYGIYAPKLTLSEIHNITIFGTAYYAMRIEYGWSNTIYNCLFSRGNNGIFLYRSANAIMMRQCSFTSLEGIAVYLEAGNGISMFDCDFEFVKEVPIYIKSRVTNLTINGCYFEGNNENGFNFTNVPFNTKTAIIINGSATQSDANISNTYKNESIVVTNNYFNEWYTNSIVFAISVIGLNIRDNYLLKEGKECYVLSVPIYDNSVTVEKVQIGNNPMFSGNFLNPPEVHDYLPYCDIRVENAIRKNYLPSIMSFTKANSTLINFGKYTDKYDGVNTFQIQQTKPSSLYYTVDATPLQGKWIQFRCKYKTLSPNVNLHMGLGFTDKTVNIGNTSTIADPSDWMDSSMYLYVPNNISEINVSFRVYASYSDSTPMSIAMTQPILAEVGTIYEDYFMDEDFNKITTAYIDPIFGEGWENGDVIYGKNKMLIDGSPYIIYSDGEWYNIDGTIYKKVIII